MSLKGETTPKQANKLKKDDYMILRGVPCKILETTHCKTGKHGPGRNVFTCTGVFDGKKYEGSAPAKDLMYVPVIKASKFSVTDLKEASKVNPKTKKEVEGVELSLMDEKFEEYPNFVKTFDKEQVKKLKNLFKNPEGEIFIIIQSWGKLSQVSDIKEEKDK